MKKNEMSGLEKFKAKVRNAYKFLFRKTQGKTPLKRPRRKWEYGV
jgi:hypothetical protein